MSTIASLICPACKDDNEVACPRDIDATCVHCGEAYCAHHILGHLEQTHCVSIEWRGFLKADVEVKGL